MRTPTRINIADVIDGSGIGGFQVLLFTLCALCLIIDGFDVFALGYAAPAIIQEWGVPNPVLGPVFAAANFGVLIGSLVFSMVADKIGRRPVLIGATLFFGTMTILTGQARNVQELLILRFIAGIGMGCIIPNATALVGEYSPRRKRVTLIMCITVGFTAGGAIGGFLAAWLIPAFGWRYVFYIGGAIPLAIGMAMLVWLPESLQFLVLKGSHSNKIGRWLRRVDPAVPVGADIEYVVHEEHKTGVPVMHLFRDGRAVVTSLLWIINFTNLLNLYSLSSWLPLVMRDAGYSASTAVRATAMMQTGGTIGTFGLAWFIGRRGFVATLGTSFAIGCVSIALIGQAGLPFWVLIAAVFAAGWCVIGGQPGLNALSATYYPTYMRATGVGAGLGVGRVGAIVGPLIGGALMARQWSNSELFLAAAAPALISTLAMVSLRWFIKPQAR